ncbi:uncharacterized protein PRCAT00000156001 [Priceomyces carsonii]|uniref:uncharacterized protein n=1 Tax=Priceomyces carsonii TaxID=28549 RepID=UPI002ED82AB3|nr:unnamed protein product [Priceomyces carsonii]
MERRSRLAYLYFIKYYSNSTKGDNSALVERFNQILDEKLSATSLTINKSPEFQEIIKKYNSEQQKNVSYRQRNQPRLSMLKNESALSYNRHARELADPALTRPWSGSESVHDANLRMLVDLQPKAKVVNLSVERKPKISSAQRIGNAREDYLDYKINKKKDDNFKEMYKEKLLGFSMLLDVSSPHTAIGMATTLADTRINAQINQRTGTFDHKSMENVRGKPLSKEHLANCMDSNYFMNQILTKQEVLPPWIESQQGINREINGFRKVLDNIWYKSFFQLIDIEKYSKEEILAQFSTIDKSSLYDLLTLNVQRPYLQEKLKLVNNSIRSYNLQSPSSSLHKFKLDLDKEIGSLFDRAISNLNYRINEIFRAREERKTSLFQHKGTSMFDLFSNYSARGSSIGTGDSVPQRKFDKVDLWSSFKQMFKEI